jgi:CHAT domain-containing protein
MERAKARGLLTLLEQRVSREPAPEENRILDELYSLDPAAQGYADRRAALEKQYVDQRSKRIQASMAPLSGEKGVVDIATVAGALDGKELVLEYALGDSASFLWVIGRDEHSLVLLPPRREIDSQIRSFRDALARVGAGDKEMLASARTLYRTLLDPAGSRMQKAKAVVIVPDGVLFDLPFDALLTSDPVAERGMGDQPFLARKVATTYAPSATVYVALKSSAEVKDFDHDLLAVGNPDFTKLAPNGTPLSPLPFAEAEVAAISADVKPARKVVLTGAGASETRVKQELRTEAPRVVHLATHGLVDGAEPTRSSVVLAANAEDDGYFYTLEILGTPTRSRLVVMSACETATGRVSRGEGVVGLSRAFLGAGAQSVVASLWSVSDESTAQLMKVFYAKMLGKKHTASRSLNEARIALIESDKFSHPFYWSPFVVTGTERSPW